MTGPLLLRGGDDAGRESLDAYHGADGWQALRAALASLTPAEVIKRVAAADLRGRGGAAFPAARKWELAASAEGTPKYVVANGGEHEPGSRKDRVLLARRPHLVLEGLALCAYATGASVGYLYVIEDMADALESVRAALEEARTAGYLGERILGTPFSLDVHLATAPTSYVAGEETAALEVIEGRKAWPRKKPPYPGLAGLYGKPTTVNNVETLANLPAVLRGVAGAGRTMLFTLDERVARPGVYEVALGATFRELLYGHGGGPRSGRGIRAILPALSSSFLPASALETPMTHQAVRDAGSGLGCGGVSFVEEGECLVERALAIARFFMKEQCGQCPPCRMETNTLVAVLAQVQKGEAGDYGAQIDKITAFARGKGFCSLIEMAAAPVTSALRHFPEDFSAHAQSGRCAPSAGG